MSPFMRWRLATPLLLLSLMGLASVVAGAWLFWSLQSYAERALTALLAIIMAMNGALSVSIGTDRRLDDTPWLRIGTIVLLFVLSCGVAVARRQL
ncbi:MAG TPA: hypothetical protein VFG99_09555 [Chloroflexia bacterium]|nr:hypothetical protein [Chloroflexia bacterium]